MRTESGNTREQEILEFCRNPKTVGEISELLGLERDRYRVIKDHLKPLIRDYKLKMTIPEFPTSMHQQYVNAESETITASEDEILEFCQTPRSKWEIGKHFDFSRFQQQRHIQRLIDAGKLLGNTPRYRVNPRQQFVSYNVNFPIASDDGIIDFCKTPKTRRELADNFRIGITNIHEYVRPLIDEEKLTIILEQIGGKGKRLQKYVST